MGVYFFAGVENGNMPDPSEHLPWLLSRSLGLAAMLFLSLSVAWGLAFASKMAQTGPGSLGRAKQIHEGLALSALLLIFLHGAVLLWDNYINPTALEIFVPFLIDNIWISLGILAGWVAFFSGLSFYGRKWIGDRWKVIHRFTLLAWVLALLHTFGAGSDEGTLPFVIYLLFLLLPVIFALVYRLLPKEKKSR